MTEEQIREIRERQRERRLLQNEKEQQADELERFFSQPSHRSPSHLPLTSPAPITPLSHPTTPHTPSIQPYCTPRTVHFERNTARQTPLSITRRPHQGSMHRPRGPQLQLAHKPRSDVWAFFNVTKTATGKVFTCKLCP
ncbi:hypothetical protein M422DRAFT_48612 [Sphaerobolus stellatus SS14]|uniref:Unplaced genomic scaffold SPHSTscaffold_815, whole genome shotgun sequence n=1 Tax=Sphaerobolus stellatus (strain SS14) TaxID=990650 RepID=A0A0C9VTU4_SPHS4|nr:hypothetical protein M422DRAFT_57028 [Sphaerobolus stellatus SS14]KIJ41586.1 hypothetical protein M422DRAFT_48612 [Sphaerobolus stellatus SS14]